MKPSLLLITPPALLLVVVIVLLVPVLSITEHRADSLQPPTTTLPPPTVGPTVMPIDSWFRLESEWGYQLLYPPYASLSYEDQFVDRAEEAGDVFLQLSGPGTRASFLIDIGTSIETLRVRGLSGTDAEVLRQYATMEWNANRDTNLATSLEHVQLGSSPAYRFNVSGGHADLLEFGDGSNWVGGTTTDRIRTRVISLCRRPSGSLYVIRLLYSATSPDTMAMVETFQCPFLAGTTDR